MSDISKKSTGFLIDQLITTNIRCWFAQDKLMDKSLSESDRLAAAVTAQTHNAIRSSLMKALDEAFGQSDITMGGEKTYDNRMGFK